MQASCLLHSINGPWIGCTPKPFTANMGSSEVNASGECKALRSLTWPPCKWSGWAASIDMGVSASGISNHQPSAHAPNAFQLALEAAQRIAATAGCLVCPCCYCQTSFHRRGRYVKATPEEMTTSLDCQQSRLDSTTQCDSTISRCHTRWLVTWLLEVLSSLIKLAAWRTS